MSPADTDDRTEVVEEYSHDCRLVREHVDRDADKYHCEGPMGRVKTFRSRKKRTCPPAYRRSRAGSAKRRPESGASRPQSHELVKTSKFEHAVTTGYKSGGGYVSRYAQRCRQL